MITLDIEQVIHLHSLLIEKTGGKDGIRDKGLLESSIYHAYATFKGEDLYPEIEEKIARQMFSLIRNHAFIDGNKRIGIFSMLVLLELNGINISFTQKELIELAIDTTEGKYDADSIIKWIKSHEEENE